MRCAWQAYLNLLPVWLRSDVDELGRDSLQETRLRINRPVECITKQGSTWIGSEVNQEDIDFVVNAASRYSPWTATEISRGYITAQGGHRVGLCGDAVGEGGKFGVRTVTSLCVRVARDFPGISGDLSKLQGSLLIVGRPGSGKTTLLRDLIREKSDRICKHVAVVDERCELFPKWQNTFCFPPGKRTDVISNCRKTIAIEMVLRTMCPQLIALDEVTSEEDSEALLHAAWCGTSLIATAHADNIYELRKRKTYQKLLEDGVFANFVVMHHSQSWTLERMTA